MSTYQFDGVQKLGSAHPRYTTDTKVSARHGRHSLSLPIVHKKCHKVNTTSDKFANFADDWHRFCLFFVSLAWKLSLSCSFGAANPR